MICDSSLFYLRTSWSVCSILATKWLMETLSLFGRTDVGLDLAFQTSYPSWGYMASMNSTTVWEHWEYSECYSSCCSMLLQIFPSDSHEYYSVDFLSALRFFIKCHRPGSQ